MPRGGDQPRAADAGGLLERGIGVAEHRRQQQEGERRPQQPLDEDHAAERIDVDGRPCAAEPIVQQRVDRPGFAEQQQPGDDVEDIGNAERDDRGQIEDLPAWRIGPLGKPGLRRADHQREQRRAQRIEHAVEQRRPERAAAEDRGEVPKGEGAEAAARIELMHARIGQEHERRNDRRRRAARSATKACGEARRRTTGRRLARQQSSLGEQLLVERPRLRQIGVHLGRRNEVLMQPDLASARSCRGRARPARPAAPGNSRRPAAAAGPLSTADSR